MSVVRAVAVPLLIVASTACSTTPSQPAVATSAPLIGVPGTTDGADHQCHVVLRRIGRVGNGTGGYVTSDSGAYVFEGVVDISAAAAAEGALPSVMYQHGSDPTWFEMYGYVDPADPSPPDGFVRYHLRLEDHLPGPGMSGTALASARVQLIPLLHLTEGGRLFDHNRRPGDLDSYQLSWTDNQLQIVDDATACPAGSAPPAPPPPSVPPAPPRGIVHFDADWSERQDGPILTNGVVEVRYALERLTSCRGSHNGYPAWDITAHARFSPGGELFEGSVRSFTTMYGHPYGAGYASPASFEVPDGATSVQIWFDNHGLPQCQAWDSNLNANYVFAVQAPPSWLGNPRARLSRDSSGPCEGGVPMAAGTTVVYDTWVRQRAAIRNVCFEAWQPGVTDRDDPGMAGKLVATVHYHLDGAASSEYWTEQVPLVERTGNNARFAWGLREIDPFRPYNCPYVTVTDDGAGYVHAFADAYVTVNGIELRPAGPGSTYRLEFVDYASDGFRATCP